MLNAVKHNVDGIYSLPNIDTDVRLTELLAMTLGFKVKRNYDQKQLAALVAALPRILKYKGTKEAIEMAGTALIATSGVIRNIVVQVQDGELKVTLPKNLVDISLFTDLLPYILPAGMTCRIIRADVIQKTYTTKFNYQDDMLAELVTDFDWDGNTQAFIGLANMFDTSADITSFANFKDNNKNKPNLGLLDNNIIPSLDSTVQGPAEELPSEPDN